MGTLQINNALMRFVRNFVQKYNHEKYWRRRKIVTDPNNNTIKLLKIYYLYYIKKTDAYHNCSFGTFLNSGTFFEEPPFLPHGPNGIIVGHDLKIGKNVIIYHQVTLANGGSIIGDNVSFGAGSKLLEGVNVGNNVLVGTNCVVIENIPDFATVVLSKPRIIIK